MTSISITGIGVISSLGIGREAFWEGCLAARSGVKQITTFDTEPYSSNVAACVVDFTPAGFMSPMTYRRMSRISRMAVAASIEAVDDSGLCLDRMNRERVAVVMGTSYGSSSHVDGFYRSLLADGPRGAQPLLFPETVPNAPASHISIYHKIQGPNATLCQNEISAETGMAYARSLLDGNVVDVVLLGGAEELSEILFGCYDAVGGLNKIRVNKGEDIQPKPGGGLILGEGAAVLIMERSESARQRGAKIYGSLRQASLRETFPPWATMQKMGGRWPGLSSVPWKKPEFNRSTSTMSACRPITLKIWISWSLNKSKAVFSVPTEICGYHR